MTEILDQLREDHRNYSHLLSLLQSQIDRFSTGEDPSYLVMHDIMKYMMNYPDILHHPAEELLFEELDNLNNEQAASLNQLSGEHKVLASRAEELEDELKIAIGGHMVSKEWILDLANQYIKIMQEHMMLEERKIFPLCESQLQQEGWDRARQKLEQATDPVFSDAESDEYARLYEGILDMTDSGQGP